MSKRTNLKETYPRSASSRENMQAVESGFLSKFSKKMKILLTPRTIIVKKDDEWDDENDDYTDDKTFEDPTYSDMDNDTPSSVSAQDEYDDYTPRKRKSVLVLIMIAFILMILAFVTYYLIQVSFNNEGRSLPLKMAEKTENYPVGAKKLETPLFGDINEPNNIPQEDFTENSDNSDATNAPQQQETQTQTDSVPFDFSPLGDKSIERLPVLPQKKTKDNQYQSFENLWSDPNKKTAPTAPSAEDYQKMNLNQLQNESLKFLPPWKRYAIPSYPTEQETPIYTIILNYDPKILSIDDLPPYPLTLAVEGYSADAQNLINQLRQKGYEIILELPMEEPKERNINVGLKPIEKGMSFDEMRNRVAWHIQNVTGHIGFKNHFGSAVLGSTAEMNFTMNLLSDAGYSFLEVIDKKDDISSVAYAYAKATNMPTRQADAVIQVIKEELPIFLKKVAKVKTGIAVINATPENISFLNQTLEKIKDYNIKLVPLSHIYTFDDVIRKNGM